MPMLGFFEVTKSGRMRLFLAAEVDALGELPSLDTHNENERADEHDAPLART